jgi:hypothetical protein
MKELRVQPDGGDQGGHAIAGTTQMPHSVLMDGTWSTHTDRKAR